MSRCNYQDNCVCQECIEWNAPLCQLCYLNRCEIKKFPEYEKYCNVCVPRDDNTLAFIIGIQNKKKVLTTIEKFKETFPNSFFTPLIDNEIIKQEDKYDFEVPRDFYFFKEIESTLQGENVVSLNFNQPLEDELWFFTGEEHNIEFLSISEDFCACGKPKLKRFYDCKECCGKLVAERAPLCVLCKAKQVNWNISLKKYFKTCAECGKRPVCKICKRNKTEWNSRKRVYHETCRLCQEYDKKRQAPAPRIEKICLQCSNMHGYMVRHVEGEHLYW